MSRRSIGAAIAGASLLIAAATAATDAHVVKQFGSYSVALGWLHEPADVGVDNAVQVIVKDAAGKSVDDIPASDFTVTVTAGGQTSAALPLNASFDPDTGLGTPGEYTAHLIPTIPGDYTFHIKGTIHGTPVDETATSSEQTFDAVVDQADAQFPTKVPSGTEISTKLDRVDARVATAQAAATDASDAANRALIVGAVVGGVGVILGLVGTGLALSLRKRRAD